MVWLMIFASTRALGHILQRLLEVLAVDMRGAGLGIPKRLDQDQTDGFSTLRDQSNHSCRVRPW